MSGRRPEDNDIIAVALRFLSYRPRSVGEIRKKLASRSFAEAEVEKAIGYLVEVGYLDDRKFAGRLAEERTRKNWGPKKVAHELGLKGIAKEVVAETVTLAKENEKEAARGALLKWARKNGLKPPLRDKEAARAARFLAGRGFSSAIIYETIGLREEP